MTTDPAVQSLLDEAQEWVLVIRTQAQDHPGLISWLASPMMTLRTATRQQELWQAALGTDRVEVITMLELEERHIATLEPAKCQD